MGTVIFLSPSNYYSLEMLSTAIKTVVTAYYVVNLPLGWEFDSKWRPKGREIDI